MHTSVVVSVDQKHGRMPSIQERHGRRFEGEPAETGIVLRLVRFAESVDHVVPVAHAVEIDVCGEEVGSPGPSKRRQIASVRATPKPDSVRGHVGTAPEAQTRTEHVVELAGAHGPLARRCAEPHAIPGAAPMIHRKHHVSVTGQHRVEGICAVVIAAVMGAQEPLTPRAPLEEEHRGVTLTLAVVGWQEQLSVDLHAVDAIEHFQGTMLPVL
jgi:hypothetical protein